MPATFRLPLLHDHHTHPLLYAAFGQAVSLLDVETKSTANELIQFEKEQASSPIVIASGWRSNLFDWTDQELEQLPPVAIFNISLHSLKLNQAGMDVIRSQYGNDVDNIQNQNWYEDHFRIVLNWFASLYASKQALIEFYAQLMKLGVYSAEEMLLMGEQEINYFEAAGLSDRTRFWASPDDFEALSTEAKSKVHGLKLFTDGAFGARTAAVNRPFLGKPDNPPNFGVLLYSDEDLDRVVGQCLDTDKSLAIHAIGDRAIEQTISTLENHSERVRAVPSVRIEHAQLIDGTMAKRAKELGLILSMQPNFNADSVDYTDRLDSQYCQSNNPFRMLIDDYGFEPGSDLVLGSDGMPHGAEFALQQSLFPSVAAQKLTLDEFRAGYCLDDETQGTLEVEIKNGVVAAAVRRV